MLKEEYAAPSGRGVGVCIEHLLRPPSPPAWRSSRPRRPRKRGGGAGVPADAHREATAVAAQSAGGVTGQALAPTPAGWPTIVPIGG